MIKACDHCHEMHISLSYIFAIIRIIFKKEVGYKKREKQRYLPSTGKGLLFSAILSAKGQSASGNFFKKLSVLLKG